MRQLTHCRICGSDRLYQYLDLGEVPLANSLRVSQDQEEEKYPIEVMLCENCYLSQLSVVVEPEVLFSNYPYHSSVSQTFKDHCRKMAEDLREAYPIHEFPLVVDIASNDGCLLKEFQKVGYKRLLGFEPAKNLGSHPYGSVEDGTAIPVVNDFFGYNTSKRIRGDDKGQGATFIIAQNVFAHVDDINDFVEGVKWFLDDEGIFIAEMPYLGNLIEKHQFDTIYHEHLSYMLLRPLMHLFENHGMSIFKVEEHPIHGGSIRIYASKYDYDRHWSVDKMLDEESSRGLYDVETYDKFAKDVHRVSEQFKLCLENLYHSGRKVMAYGASAKGISLLNYAGIKREYIHSIVDDTPDKQEKYTPGTGIPIVPFEKFEYEHPEFIVLLAWNFQKELMAKCWWYSGYWVVPIPEVSVF